MDYIKLGLCALLPAVVSAALRLLDKKTAFGRIGEWKKQIVYGIVFGALAIFGTEFGVPINGAQLNCRDAAVLTAGLMFGAPAGLIAGTLGAVERWFAVYWGVGSFTRIACSVATFAAGIYSALLRRFMFEDKKPGFLLSGTIGVVVEIFHLSLLFITNMNEPAAVMSVITGCGVQLVAANGISVMLACIVLTLLSKERIELRQDKIRISQTVQRWLFLTVVLAFSITSYFVFSLQNAIADAQTDQTLSSAIEEVIADMAETGEAERRNVVRTVTKNRVIGKSGYMLVLDENGDILSAPDGYDPSEAGRGLPDLSAFDEKKTFTATLNKLECCCSYAAYEGLTVLAIQPAAEAKEIRNVALCVNMFMEILVFAVLFAQIYMLIKRVVVNQIKSINASLAKITGGDLDEVINVRSNAEFASLSDDINTTVSTLKRYIAEASAKIDRELEFAKNIQTSALPNVFPAFPNRRDIDIFAFAEPAKEVGGDFYDFYLSKNDKLHFVIADVSGKGIPAAMFMMRAKTELKSLTDSEKPIGEVFTLANDALCEGNDAGMFVTAWQGGLDLATGEVTFANAGHNPPLIRHADGSCAYLKMPTGFVLAGEEGFPYRQQSFSLTPGDVVFLYTDGVTEAANDADELFGEERLLAAVNSAPCDDMKEFCLSVRTAVERFVGEAPQFDDITMLAVRYDGFPTFRVENAVLDDITRVIAFAEAELEKIGCSPSVVISFNVAIDEIFSNIVRYGYPDGTGPVTVQIIEHTEPHEVYIRFADEGVPYNPLAKEDPDVTLSAEDREIGGLGIFIVKKTMDGIRYKYENGQNVLTVMKKL